MSISSSPQDVPPNLGGLLDSVNGGMSTNLDDSVAQLRKSSDKAYDANLKQAQIQDKDADLDVKDQASLKNWYKENPYPVPDIKPFTEAPPKVDAMRAFGSWASVIGILAGALTKTPLVSSLRASAAAMSSLRQNDLDGYQARKDAWKSNNEAAIQRAEWEVKGYENALDMMKTDTALGHAALAAHAAAAGNVAMAEMNRAGDIEKIGEYVSSMNRSLAQGVETQQKFDEFSDKKKSELVATRQFFKDHPQYGVDPNDPQLAQKAQALSTKNTDIAEGLRIATATQTGKEKQLSSGAKPKSGMDSYVDMRRTEYEAKNGEGSYTSAMELQDMQAYAKAVPKGNTTAPTFTKDNAKFAADIIKNGGSASMFMGGFGGSATANKAMVLDALKAEGVTPEQIVAAEANLKGLQQESRTIGVRSGQISVAANEVKQLTPLAKASYDALPRTDFVPFNKLEAMVESNTASTEQVRSYYADYELISAQARVVSPTGVPTDSVRDSLGGMLSNVTGPEAHDAVIDQINQTVDAIQNASENARDQLRAEFSQAQTPDDLAPVQQKATGGSGGISDGATATGPGGTRIIFRNGAWVPYSP